MSNQVPQEQPTAEKDEQPQEEAYVSNKFLFFSAIPSWLVSTIVHSIIIILLMILELSPPQKEFVRLESDPIEEQEIEEIEEVKIEEIDLPTFEDAPPEEMTEMVETLSEVEEVTLDAAQFESDIMALELDTMSDVLAPTAEISMSMGDLSGTGVASRSESNRKQMVKDGGGTDASEAAVAKALKWIAAHQLPDGSWSFDHLQGPGSFRTSPNPGEFSQSRFAPTAMAILPFLGAGQTHLEGQYKKNVEAGLNFLILNQKATTGGGSFVEGQGNLYSHGLATIALCEAYAMTKDSNLIVPAQAAINYTCYAQDPVGGGWRYKPHQPGDTSAVGWQLMALKSGHMGYLEVPKPVLKKSVNFLDAVSSDNGAFYGYTGPGRGKATTAIGLLCRMYMGWNQDHPGLKKGVEYLAGQGPDATKNANMYYNYYATQVMRHNGGEHWDTWNKKMRDFLVTEQADSGNATGSWYFNGGHGATHGGRLYNTSLATMVLEVYYRHMPIYKTAASDDEFKLD